MGRLVVVFHLFKYFNLCRDDVHVSVGDVYREGRCVSLSSFTQN